MTLQANISAFSKAIAEERIRIGELQLRKELIATRAERMKLEAEIEAMRNEKSSQDAGGLQ